MCPKVGSVGYGLWLFVGDKAICFWLQTPSLSQSFCGGRNSGYHTQSQIFLIKMAFNITSCFKTGSFWHSGTIISGSTNNMDQELLDVSTNMSAIHENAILFYYLVEGYRVHKDDSRQICYFTM